MNKKTTNTPGRTAAIDSETRWGDTAEAAAKVKFRPQTLRRHLCVNGHFFGIKPTKLPGGRGARLLWPLDQFERLAAGLPVEGV